MLKAKKKYKPVAKKVRSVISEMPDKFRIVRNIVGDPLADLPELDPRPAPFKPGTRYTEARRAAVRENHQEFLWPAELDILDDLILKAEKGFAWTESERGAFRTDFFPPVEIPTIPHTPWVLKKIPIPPGIYPEVCQLIRKKIDSGVYERSNASYSSRWFCVVMKDGTSLRIVHSLEPLNAVTIQDSGVPPSPEYMA